MIERFESALPIDPRVIDRLVDGELSAGEERGLLAALDFQPDGWRCCALAFLEARVWKNELAAVTRCDFERVNGKAAVLSAPAVGSASARASAPAATAPWMRAMAVAASIALAFWLGVAMRGYWGGAASDGRVVATGEQDASMGNASGGAGAPSSVRAGVSAAEQPTITMTVIGNDGDVERQLEIPVVETDTFDPRWLQRPPSAIPQELASALRRSGHRVEEQRLYVPVLLEDGRQAIIPLDQAEVRFVGVSY
jgi:hypothetical protein